MVFPFRSRWVPACELVTGTIPARDMELPAAWWLGVCCRYTLEQLEARGYHVLDVIALSIPAADFADGLGDGDPSDPATARRPRRDVALPAVNVPINAAFVKPFPVSPTVCKHMPRLCVYVCVRGAVWRPASLGMSCACVYVLS